MAFKINVSDKGKTAKFETDNEELVGQVINTEISGNLISPDLDGYTLKITGTSDTAGFPGLPEVKGPRLERVLLTKGIAMHAKKKGLRLRKTVRGNEISASTSQINTIVVKEGKKKFGDLTKKEETPAEEGSEEKKE